MDDRIAFDAASRPRLKEYEAIDNAFMGDVIATWTFLNVFGEPLHLDPFTLDDYIDALRYQETDFPCDLTIEIHCALLKALVPESEPESIVSLPTMRTPKTKNYTISQAESPEAMDVSKEDDNTSISTDRDSSNPSEYSSLLEIRASAKKSGVSTWTDWRTRIQARDFSNGGWEFALIGLIDELGNSLRLTSTIVDILENFLPENLKNTRKFAREQYSRLAAQHKVNILLLLTQLVCQTPTVREFIEESMSSMTELRKEKVDVQRERKVRLEELAALEAELQPYNSPEDSVNGHDSDLTESEAPVKRSVKASLKRKREEAEELAAQVKRNKEHLRKQKLVDEKREEIKECEDRVVQYDHDLRERDCQRLRLLGKDRFFNRYWYLEGNGVSRILQNAGYLSARLWVQGPSFEDAMFYLGGAGVEMNDVPEGRVSLVHMSNTDDDNILRERILLRKEREEGQTVLYDENQWAYYDTQEGVEGLIAWLNPKGIREAKLRQTLLAKKDAMYKLMEARDKVGPPSNWAVVNSSIYILTRNKWKYDGQLGLLQHTHQNIGF